ncbi:MAG: hypothetical protein HN975_16770 [Anaerolineae bacterium]|jgi:hypothetical protein|nr:hypothetical protein [Anaerolineae bacterium]MBT7991419.1 hypothetical protein [Anaerolineae bacterium]
MSIHKIVQNVNTGGSLGILTRLSSGDDFEAYQAYRNDRYRLQEIASGVLGDRRLSGCCKSVITLGNMVDILKNGDTGKCRYDGLMLCGSVWQCPVCAARITLQRKQELLTADLSGYSTGLLTLTVSHGQHDTLKSLLADLSLMRNKLKSGRWWKDFRTANDFTGAITTTEVTHGVNGWHVHYHMLMIFEVFPNYEQLETHFYDRWEALAGKQGRYTSAANGVDFRECEKLDYLTKWSTHSELVYGDRKDARNGNISIWEMLRRIGAGDQQYEKYFREYSRCFKGKKQLVWGRGLKQLLSVGEGVPADDAAIELLMSLSRDDWRLILKHGQRAKILELAEASGASGVLAYLSSFSSTIRIASDLYK